MTKCIKYKGHPNGYQFTECGLDYVFLMNGYEIIQDEVFGESITIYNADKLHREIARAVLLYREKLEGQEIKFFRSLLRLTQEQLGNKLGLRREEIVRWENNKNNISDTADGFLRIIVWEEYLDEDRAFRFFEKHKKDRLHYKTIEMMEANNKWKSKVAA